jgi:hypothetical protein
MAVGALGCQGKGMTNKDKEARLAAALRENLRKRKASGTQPKPLPEPPEPGEKRG